MVERKHGHILEVARALRFQAGLPIRFWDEYVSTAAYLINHTPMPLLFGKSPYELLFSTKPDYSHLCVFGCLCYASTLSHNRIKFDLRAQQRGFIGYPPAAKVYKLYDLQTHSIFSSRDAIFHEHLFAFRYSPSNKRRSTYRLMIFTIMWTKSPNPIELLLDKREPTVSENCFGEQGHFAQPGFTVFHDHRLEPFVTRLLPILDFIKIFQIQIYI